jgi:SAM-dependent methyltransferase
MDLTRDNVPQLADEQIALWNGAAGHAWVETQAVIDQVYKPLEDVLVEEVSSSSSRRVLDVGCGTGATTFAIARLVGATGRAVGIDISAPMIAAARGRAEEERVSATFIHASAQDHTFEPASFDLIVSRFGVMFFANPIAAFANLRRAATDHAALRCIVWRGAVDNPFMTTAERAAAPVLPNLPPRRPDAPGQFAFANRDRVARILRESGWTRIDIRPIDVSCAFPAKELILYITRLGPVGLMLQAADDRTRNQVVATVRPAFDPFVHGAEVRFTAACWMVGAHS